MPASTSTQGIEGGFLDAVEGDSRVEKVYLYHSEYVSHVGGVELVVTLCDDFGKINNQSVVFEGRFPKFDHEIALAAKYARERGFAIGDEIEIAANGRQASYLITGKLYPRKRTSKLTHKTPNVVR